MDEETSENKETRRPGRPKITRRKEKDVLKSKSVKRPKRKNVTSVEDPNQRGEEVAANKKTDTQPQRRKKGKETQDQKSEELPAEDKPDRGNRSPATKRKKNEAEKPNRVKTRKTEKVEEEGKVLNLVPKREKAKKTKKVEEEEVLDLVPKREKTKKVEEEGEVLVLVPKREKTKKTNKVEEGEVLNLVPRRLQLSSETHKFVGAHVSIQGGLWNAALEAGRIGARAFGLFLRSQRTWNSKTLEESSAEKFRRTCAELGLDSRFILPHSPYLMNLGSPKPDVRQKSRDMLVDELGRCRLLGLTIYNIHPGSHVGEMPVDKCLELIADGINHAHSQVPGVTVVLENMSRQGSTVGGRFQELRGIIDLVEDKTRIGVCLDTCHAFAAGHNLAEEAGLRHMLDEFEETVGLSYLRAVHLNDSKGKVGCRLDRHENIGRGHIGVTGFRQVMNEPRFNDIPMILETPYNAEFDEIELLYSLCAESGGKKRNAKKASTIAL
ncbi:probable endonuclease 4 isoform X2 [Hyperolius riggenbachi]|uniref:probable endonuclease 4 isoform X2 n=1 Tax=Hyperolius riggenbachi TaxID=752182 RepID=UPI0035A2A500